MIRWIRQTFVLTGVLVLIQLMGALVFGRLYPFEVYTPVCVVVLGLLPDSWRFIGNVPLGLGVWMLAVLVGSTAIAGMLTTIRASVSSLRRR